VLSVVSALDVEGLDADAAFSLLPVSSFRIATRSISGFWHPLLLSTLLPVVMATSDISACLLSFFKVMDGRPFHLGSAYRELTIQILRSSVDHIASAFVAAASAFSIEVAGSDALARFLRIARGERTWTYHRSLISLSLFVDSWLAHFSASRPLLIEGSSQRIRRL